VTTTYLTPGVYIRPAERVRPVGPLVRSDVAAFLGYARRGPAFRPVRVESWREFLVHFGDPYEVGYLAPAVRAFFENGGTTCWVVRVLRTGDAGGGGSAAEASLLTEPVTVAGDEYRWRFAASFNPAFLDEPVGSGLEDPGPGGGASSGLSGPRRQPDPGAWGNQLRVSVTRDVSLRTRTVPGPLEEGWVTAVEGLGGLDAHSVVELSQEGAEDRALAVREVDHARSRITWERRPAELGFDPTRPIRLESVELAVRVLLGGRVIETFRRLGVHPQHARALVRVIPRESRLLDLTLRGPSGTPPESLPWTRPELWPVGVDAQLSGGADGLTEVTAADHQRALDSTRRVEEIALLAAPDLVLRAAPPSSRPPATPPSPPCASLEPRAEERGALSRAGRLVQGEGRRARQSALGAAA
jgi:hypothetical protein